METAYISAILISGKYDLTAVDGYSVETTALSVEMANEAFLQGKKLYGWTANSAHAFKKVLRCSVDGIITDNVPYAGYFVDSYGKHFFAENIADLFFGEDVQNGTGGQSLER